MLLIKTSFWTTHLWSTMRAAFWSMSNQLEQIIFHAAKNICSTSLVRWLSCVWLFATPWTAACQASLSITNTRSLPKLTSIESVMPSNHLILCRPLLLPSVFPTSGSFPVSQFSTSGGQSIGASALASVLPVNIQDWFPLGWTGWISLLSKGLCSTISWKKRKSTLPVTSVLTSATPVCPRLFSRRYEKVPVILVGNKVDLESEREVSSNEGRALAEEWGCPFMETSAKSKTMVDELFAEIVRQMNYAAQPDKDDPCCSACNIQ